MKTQNFIVAGFGVVFLSIFNLQLSTAMATPKVTKVAAGADFSLFIRSDGSLWAMGANYHGELGDGNIFATEGVTYPEPIVASNVTSVAAGGGFTLFRKSDGSLWATGNNAYGELGDGTYMNHYVPEQIVSSQVTVIAAGGNFHSLFGKYRFPLGPGSLWGMGANFYGQLGIGTPIISTNTPQEIFSNGPFLGSPAVTAVAAGGYHSLFIEPGGSLWAMGDNEFGQLGNGTTNNQYLPEEIVASNVVAVAAGWDYTLFVKSDGSLWAMGGNHYGQLGDGTTNEQDTPEEIVSSNVTAIAAGYHHSLFIKTDGSLWGMGWNPHGQLGDYTTVDQHSPEEIVASNVVAVAAGLYHSLFIKSDGSLWAMGANYYGQLGDGTTNNVHIPIKIAPHAIKNGGFELGDFKYWTTNGNVAFTYVMSKLATCVHSGRYGALFGPVGSLGYLSQTYDLLTAGERYWVSFWLDTFDEEPPNEFRVSWNDATLFDQTNLPATGWTHFQFLVTATTSTAVLQFGFRNDNSYFGLDDISVVQDRQPVITGISPAGTNLVLDASNGQSDSTYFTLMSTNVALPFSQWTPVATNLLNADGDFTITATNAMNPNTPQEFYTLQLQN